ncbi:MAG TPA: AMP-binding protein, partial [Steroidobacteraceae bacterium]|nr:AMP-binding protein [Steroidobacteraceae bacterium]
FHSSSWWSSVRDSGATVMHYLGVMPAMLLQLPPAGKDRDHSVHFGFGGGVRAEHHARFEERFGIPLIEAWAMTETGGAGTISTHEGARHIGSGCIGRPSPRYGEARVVDEQGREVPAGQIGELVVRASLASPRQGFFSGYYKDAAATEAAWKDGWLHTGDLARRDPEGSFFFAGRRKQIIRRSGENISAAEVEAAVGADSRVRAAAIVGVPDAVREEEVFACIVVRNDVEPSLETARAIMGSLAQQLSYFKLPGYIAFVSELPVTATQKLRYGAVAEQALALLAGSDPHVFEMRSEKSQSRRAAAQGPRQC